MTKLSRSKLELFFDCPRCFWLYVGHGIGRPSSAPYTINNAIDKLLKNEFDQHRTNGTAHYLIQREGIDAIPFKHAKMDEWRHNFTGIQYKDHDNNFLIFGAVDDIWIDSNGALIVVDYKASGNPAGELYDAYKRQIEIYQWLLRQNGFIVSNRGYFVYCRVSHDQGFANGQLNFNIQLEHHDGDDSWIPNALKLARQTLDQPIPEPAKQCTHCKYIAQTAKYTTSQFSLI